jgi:intracellular sulfur oxidation DsrE/DsrF family protein
VFEISSSDKDALKWAIPRIQQYTNTLRQKFPGLDVAIVSHGREQFVLQKKNSKEYEKVHKAVKELSSKGDVPVHICQTFAAWNDVSPEEFPDYVSVSATGPQQVNDYIELGYALIKLRKQ